LHRLAELGAEVEVDGEGQVQLVRFSGHEYDDSIIHHLSVLAAVPIIDLRETAISKAGIEQLRRLLPDCTIYDE
jgi:hypothetical protein